MAGLLSNRPFCSNDLMILSAYKKSRWSINCTYFRCTVLLLLLLMESRTQNMYYYYTGGFSSPSLVNLSCHIWPKNCVSRKFCLMPKLVWWASILIFRLSIYISALEMILICLKIWHYILILWNLYLIMPITRVPSNSWCYVVGSFFVHWILVFFMYYLNLWFCTLNSQCSWLVQKFVYIYIYIYDFFYSVFFVWSLLKLTKTT